MRAARDDALDERLVPRAAVDDVLEALRRVEDDDVDRAGAQRAQHEQPAEPPLGRGLVELVRDQASVPTLLHLDGNCHTYVHSKADLDKAAEVIRNAKLRRTGVCGATESIVVDKAVAEQAIPKIAAIFGDDAPALTEADVRAMKVVELRAALVERGRDATGLKPALVERLVAAKKRV